MLRNNNNSNKNNNNSNNNNNNRDDIYGAVIIAKPLREFPPVHMMNADSAPRWLPTLRPSLPTWDCECESARKKWHLPSTSTIAILLLFSLRADSWGRHLELFTASFFNTGYCRRLCRPTTLVVHRSGMCVSLCVRTATFEIGLKELSLRYLACYRSYP